MTLHVFAPYGRTAASTRVRVLSWIDRVRPDAVVHTYLGLGSARASTVLRHPAAMIDAERSLRALVRRAPDRVLIHRECSPLSDGSIERALLRRARHGVVDFDDALQWDWGYGSRLRRLRPKAPKIIAALKAADRVIAGNALLAGSASRWAREVVVIPSCVDPERYVEKASFDLADPPVIGWIGSQSTQRYLLEIEPALLEVHRRTGARIALLGPTGPTLGSLERIIDRHPWSELAAQTLPGRWDLGVMPLEDGIFERGKCGYKLLEYGACALPMIGSAVGVNSEILARAGMPAPRTQPEWVDALLQMIGAPAHERARLGERARGLVEREFSYRRWEPAWRAALELPADGEPEPPEPASAMRVRP